MSIGQMIFFWYFSVSFSSLPQFKAIEQHNYAEYELVLNTIIYIMCGNMVSFLSFSRSQRAAASFPMGLLFTHTRFYAEFFCQLYYGFAFIGARHSVCDVCARAFFHMQNIFLSLIAQPKLNAIYWRWLIDNKFVVGPSEEAIDQQSKLMLWRKIMKKNLQKTERNGPRYSKKFEMETKIKQNKKPHKHSHSHLYIHWNSSKDLFSNRDKNMKLDGLLGI